MKISIVIPAFNEEVCLAKCLESVLAEKKKGKYDMEIIVVNNASTDHTREIAASYSEVKIVDEPKKGLSAARQAGFQASVGDLVANIDADTVLTPGWLDTVMESFTKKPDLIAFSGPFIYHDLSLFTNVLVRIQYYIDFLFYFYHKFILRISSVLQGGNYIIRRSALVKVGGYNLDYVCLGEDAYMAKVLNPLGPVIFSLRLPIYSSGRRIKKEGLIAMCFKYGLNYISTVNHDRLMSEEDYIYDEVRYNEDHLKPFQTTLESLNRAMLVVKGVIILAILIIIWQSLF